MEEIKLHFMVRAEELTGICSKVSGETKLIRSLQSSMQSNWGDHMVTFRSDVWSHSTRDKNVKPYLTGLWGHKWQTDVLLQQQAKSLSSFQSEQSSKRSKALLRCCSWRNWLCGGRLKVNKTPQKCNTATSCHMNLNLFSDNFTLAEWGSGVSWILLSTRAGPASHRWRMKVQPSAFLPALLQGWTVPQNSVPTPREAKMSRKLRMRWRARYYHDNRAVMDSEVTGSVLQNHSWEWFRSIF